MPDRQYPFWFNRDFPTKARPAKGGVRSRSQRGRFVESWWAQRWLSFLDQFQLGGRLDRGKTYARKGQVLDVKIEKGVVTAAVQGSRPDPYDVELRMKEIAAEDWKRLGRVLQSRPKFAALLFAGEMPQDIEKAFEAAKLTLFPLKGTDFNSKCSCPDWSNPCKHVAAVYYLLGEEFDRDPFLIFKLRGLGRDELLSLLSTDEISKASSRRRAVVVTPATGLPEMQRTIDGASLETFWKYDRGVQFNFVPPAENGMLIKRLKHFPFWKGTERFDETFLPLYKKATERSLKQLEQVEPDA